MADLLITAGPDQGRSFPLGDSQVLGRLPKNGIPLADTRTSREHARIYRGADGFYLVDLNSKNGTMVNGERVHKQKLKAGDEILLGETYGRIQLSAEDVLAFATSGSASQVVSGGEEIAVRRRDVGGGVSADPLRTKTARSLHSNASLTRTSLAWMRTDLSQVSGLYRALLYLGGLVLFLGLAWLGYRLTGAF